MAYEYDTWQDYEPIDLFAPKPPLWKRILKSLWSCFKWWALFTLFWAALTGFQDIRVILLLGFSTWVASFVAIGGIWLNLIWVWK